MEILPQPSNSDETSDPSHPLSDLRQEVLRYLRGTGLTEFAAEAGVLEKCGSFYSGAPVDENAHTAAPEAELFAHETLHSGITWGRGDAPGEKDDREQNGAYLGLVADQWAANASNFAAYAGTLLRDVSPKQRKMSGVSPRRRQKHQHLPRDSKARTSQSGRKGTRKCVFVSENLPEAESHTGGRPNGKGLRHFSSKVCEKVETKGRTTYNEVADELVLEMRHRESDEKNIRRRVYDALNVLMALGIITKEKKQFYWKGLPEAPASKVASLEKEKARLSAKIAQKQAYLQELVKQYESQRDLIERNKERPLDFNRNQSDAIQLPFFLVQVDPMATVEMQMSDDFQDVYFDFQEDRFQIHDDVHVLRSMAENPVPLKTPPKVGEAGIEHGENEAKTLLSEEVLLESQDDDSSQRSTLVQPSFPSRAETSNKMQNGKSGPRSYPGAARQVPQNLTKGSGTYRRFEGSSPFVPWLGASYIPPMPNHA
ncbi:hypothetical protein BSKO_00303 [Bryopsis sp. KO-2023]|nr:hypothetical protein BSKO_00303 [Bryopsis sp. KO-2023]